MVVDWDLVVRLGVPIVTTVSVAVLKRIWEDRPKLVKYVSHASAFPLPEAPQTKTQGAAPSGSPPQPARSAIDDSDNGGRADHVEVAVTPVAESSAAPATALPPAQRQWLHAHSVLVRNMGKKSAFNVRIGHNSKPMSYQISPAVDHTARDAPNAGWEILIPALVPDEAVQIAYLYWPPMTWNQIDSYVKSDECSAIALHVVPMPLESVPKRALRKAIYYIGVASIAYFLTQLGLWTYNVAQTFGQAPTN